MSQSIALVNIKLSVVVTVYSETYSVLETVERLIKLNRGYIVEIILLLLPRASEETKQVCQQVPLNILWLESLFKSKIQDSAGRTERGWRLR